MEPELLRRIERYAAIVLEWLEEDAKEHHIHRTALVDLFLDTVNVLDQMQEQED